MSWDVSLLNFSWRWCVPWKINVAYVLIVYGSNCTKIKYIVNAIWQLFNITVVQYDNYDSFAISYYDSCALWQFWQLIVKYYDVQYNSCAVQKSISFRCSCAARHLGKITVVEFHDMIGSKNVIKQSPLKIGKKRSLLFLCSDQL